MRQFVLPIALSVSLVAACEHVSATKEPVVEAPTDPAELRAGLIADGEEIIVENCAQCHAIGPYGESPRFDAPPLRYVLANRDVEALTDDFREGIHVGAEDMPNFDFGPLGTDAVIAYIQSIQEEPAS